MKVFSTIKKWFDISEKEVKKMSKTVQKINALEETMQKLSDEEIQHKTEEFKLT